jgi:WD40 repeat protein
LWDAATGAERLCLRHHHQVNAVSFAPDGRTLASGCRDGTVRIWDAATGVERFPLQESSDRITAVGFSPDGRILASGSTDRTVRLWDATIGHCLACFPMCADTIRALWFDRKALHLLAAAAGEVVRAPKVYRLDLIHIVHGGAWQVPVAQDE